MTYAPEIYATKKFSTLSKYLAMRLEQDPGFVDKIKADPKNSLIDLGFDEEMLRENGATADECTCYDTTCWSSECPGTCQLSATWVPYPTEAC